MECIICLEIDHKKNLFFVSPSLDSLQKLPHWSRETAQYKDGSAVDYVGLTKEAVAADLFT